MNNKKELWHCAAMPMIEPREGVGIGSTYQRSFPQEIHNFRTQKPVKKGTQDKLTHTRTHIYIYI